MGKLKEINNLEMGIVQTKFDHKIYWIFKNCAKLVTELNAQVSDLRFILAYNYIYKIIIFIFARNFAFDFPRFIFTIHLEI